MRKEISYPIFVSPKLKEKVWDILKSYPDRFTNKKKDPLYYILSLLTEIPARNKRKGRTKDGYTLLSSKDLRKIVSNYKEHFNDLIFFDVIECDNKFKPGKKSKGYRIYKEFLGPIEVTAIQNPILIRKIKRYDKKKDTTKYNYLRKWMDGIEINYEPASRYTKSLYEYRVQHPDAREKDYKTGRYKDPLYQYNSALINLHYLKIKRINFHVDDNVNRLHTNLANMPSDLRNFITWNGQKLVCIDISNSQPYLATKLFRRDFYFTSRGRGNFLNIQNFSKVFSLSSSLSSSSSSFSPSLLPPLMLQKPSQWTESEDVKLFIHLVEKGGLYEHLADAFNKELGLKHNDRKAIKAAVFQLLFTDNRFIGQEEAAPKRIFKKLFPNVYELFATYKKGNPTILPRLLQQMEAMLILDIICKRISKERPDVPLFTIHDSITTTLDNLDYVKRIMTDELTNHVGIKPSLKVEYWVPENIKIKKVP